MSAAAALTAAEKASAAVRTLNHETIVTAVFNDPVEVYRLLGVLSELAHLLPQAFAQLERICDRLGRVGECGLDDDTSYGSALAALAEAGVNLDSAKVTCLSLAHDLDLAHQAISPVYATGVSS